MNRKTLVALLALALITCATAFADPTSGPGPIGGGGGPIGGGAPPPPPPPVGLSSTASHPAVADGMLPASIDLWQFDQVGF